MSCGMVKALAQSRAALVRDGARDATIAAALKEGVPIPLIAKRFEVPRHVVRARVAQLQVAAAFPARASPLAHAVTLGRHDAQVLALRRGETKRLAHALGCSTTIVLARLRKLRDEQAATVHGPGTGQGAVSS